MNRQFQLAASPGRFEPCTLQMIRGGKTLFALLNELETGKQNLPVIK
jgi:hypothetical protein